jgi:hypothetical protein
MRTAAPALTHRRLTGRLDFADLCPAAYQPIADEPVVATSSPACMDAGIFSPPSDLLLGRPAITMIRVINDNVAVPWLGGLILGCIVCIKAVPFAALPSAPKNSLPCSHQSPVEFCGPSDTHPSEHRAVLSPRRYLQQPDRQSIEPQESWTSTLAQLSSLTFCFAPMGGRPMTGAFGKSIG